MPFVIFKNSKGAGFVVPDGHGGTKLAYLHLKATDELFETTDFLDENGEVLVEGVPVHRIVNAA
ncbi:MAG TPA: hypothetical protein VGX69_11510 [Solirubrobacteraceae bacterium]|jgi:hypothetical protein|nr:hypothetical protein [Solirubrobacteraceae bacterium]